MLFSSPIAFRERCVQSNCSASWTAGPSCPLTQDTAMPHGQQELPSHGTAERRVGRRGVPREVINRQHVWVLIFFKNYSSFALENDCSWFGEVINRGSRTPPKQESTLKFLLPDQITRKSILLSSRTRLYFSFPLTINQGTFFLFVLRRMSSPNTAN